MKLRTALLLSSVLAATAVPAMARDALPLVTTQSYALEDGSTLHVFTDGKMAREDRFGRAATLKPGEMLVLKNGQKLKAVGNEVARLSVILSEHDGS